MKNHFLLILAFSALLLSCGKKEEEQQDKTKSAADALQQFADKAKDMQTREKVDPIDFRKLRELLPEEIAGFKRTEASGEKNGAMGFTISTADARYKGDNDASIHLEILDTGGVAGVATMAMAAWTMADIDKETDTGYEKTTSLEGYKAFEKYDSQNKSGELNLLVADRYVVNVNGNNVTMEQMKSILGDLDLDKLADLK
ncbi:hypothetical protein [Dyadobacter psychrotolerans]|uniref:Uncharacterized protein n=1 Tax=Dyadobacter psychrotolerans TaxID=2541721 RepID=A0A4V2Z377_9BACT|nr:hypothetical protein [Dyadobacter psychrotolerans]TDE11658.1 hypothetical protein E0F88_24850 [Dyadobacter psychrotolerans]